MQYGIMIIINVALSFQLRILISWHGNLQEGEKVFLVGGTGCVGARKRVRDGPSEELKELCGSCFERRGAM